MIPPETFIGTEAVTLAVVAIVASEKSVALNILPHDIIPVLKEFTIADAFVAEPHLFEGTTLQ